MHVYGASDFAVTQDGGDYTVHIVVGVDPNDRMYVLDVWRKRTSADVWVEAYCDLVLQWSPLEWAFEGGQIRSSVGPFLERRARERRAYCAPKIFPSRRDKSVRAQAIRGKMALDSLYVPIHAHWFPDFFAELLSFPAGKHDDQVDALSLIGQMQTRITRGRVPEPKAKLKVLTVGDPNTQEAISLKICGTWTAAAAEGNGYDRHGRHRRRACCNSR
jgi:predicted phage terminase large subunit-like protein